jgi:hypothetical protein
VYPHTTAPGVKCTCTLGADSTTGAQVPQHLQHVPHAFNHLLSPAASCSQAMITAVSLCEVAEPAAKDGM